MEAAEAELAKIKAVTAAVLKAEGSNLQADVDAAKVLVTALPNGAAKTALQGRINAVQSIIDAAAAVSGKITALPASGAVTLADEDKIEAARDAYEALTPDQKALVDIAALEAAEAELAEIKALIAAKSAAKTDLATAFSRYDSDDYSSVNWTALTNAKTAGDTAIDAATNIAGVTAAKEAAIASMAAVRIRDRSSGGSSQSPLPQQETGNSIVVVNGESTSAGTENNTTTDGKSITLIQVNNEVVNSKIEEGIKNNSIGVVNTIQISSSDKSSGEVAFELTGDTVKKLEDNNFDVSVKNNNIEYIIHAKEFTIIKVAEELNILEKDLKEIKVEVKITKQDDDTIEKYNQIAKDNGSEIIFPPVSFEVVANTTRKDGSIDEVVISKFSNYVERVMEIPAGVDQNNITTGIVFNQDGTYSHVPTQVFQKEGKWYAKINSLTNSIYSVIWNPVAVKSVEDHWSKDAVNDMASRLVVFNAEAFTPDKAITRADFAEYIVRALGIYRKGSKHENIFKDVSANGDRTLAILIANEYGIVTGYPDGTFRPDALITREEAMTMYQRAMKVTKLVGTDTNRYQSYTDYKEVSSWATPYVKEVLSAHVFNGNTVTTISPKSNLTYAEAAQAIKNLLVVSKLINK